jgi:hypothetical protein
VHRIVVVSLREESPEKFLVTADSADAGVTRTMPKSLPEWNETAEWADRHTSPGYSAPASTLHLGLQGIVTGLSYWRVDATGKVLDYDFAKAGLSERKVITSGRLVCEFDDRTYVAETGDTIMYLTDPEDVDEHGEMRPFFVRFRGDDPCTVVYTDFAVAEPALSATDEVARTQLGFV